MRHRNSLARAADHSKLRLLHDVSVCGQRLRRELECGSPAEPREYSGISSINSHRLLRPEIAGTGGQMSGFTSKQRKAAYIVALVLLSIPIVTLGMPAGEKSTEGSGGEGGMLAQLRTKLELGEPT